MELYKPGFLAVSDDTPAICPQITNCENKSLGTWIKPDFLPLTSTLYQQKLIRNERWRTGYDERRGSQQEAGSGWAGMGRFLLADELIL